MVFSGANAEAQAGHNGYTYSQRVCQEYGQQPRWYNVRDGQAAYNGGNSDSGWLIVLARGSGTTYTFGAPIFFTQLTIPFPIELAAPLRRAKRQVTDSSSGITGFVTYQSDGAIALLVIVDRNNDGDITRGGDRTAGLNSNEWEVRAYTTETYGGSYIRWANMAWCR